MGISGGKDYFKYSCGPATYFLRNVDVVWTSVPAQEGWQTDRNRDETFDCDASRKNSDGSMDQNFIFSDCCSDTPGKQLSGSTATCTDAGHSNFGSNPATAASVGIDDKTGCYAASGYGHEALFFLYK